MLVKLLLSESPSYCFQYSVLSCEHDLLTLLFPGDSYAFLLEMRDPLQKRSVWQFGATVSVCSGVRWDRVRRPRFRGPPAKARFGSGDF